VGAHHWPNSRLDYVADFAQALPERYGVLFTGAVYDAERFDRLLLQRPFVERVQRSSATAHLASWMNLALADSEDRFDVYERAEEGAGPADSSTPLQVFQRIEDEEEVDTIRGVLRYSDYVV
jgi:hypothetical protein